MFEKSEANTLDNYKALKSNVVLPLKIKLFYSLLEDLNQKNGSLTSSVSKDQAKKYKNFIAGFKRLAEDQQDRYLLETLKLVKNGLSKEKEKQESFGSSESDAMEYIKQIETTCKVKESFLGFTKWEKKCFKLNTRSSKVRLIDGKKQLIINLAFYLVRKSTKHSRTITLFAISQNIDISKSQLYLSFDNFQLFEEVYNLIFNCITELQAKQILRLALQTQKDKQQNKQQSLKTINDDMSKASIILTTKVLNDYFEKKDKFLKKFEKQKQKFQTLDLGFGEDTKVAIFREKNKDKIKIEKNYKMNLEKLIDNLSIFNRQTNDKLIQYEVLQTFSTNIHVVYFKYYFNKEIYQFLAILQQNTRKDEKTLFFKGIDNFINKQFVDFLCLRLKQVNNDTVSLKLMGIVKSDQINKNQASGFLLSLIQLEDRKQACKKEVKLEQFWTVRQIQNVQLDDPDDYYGNGLENQQVLKRSRKFSSEQSKTIKKCLFNKKYIIDPTQNPLNNYITEHTLFTQFRLHKNGGVLCTNQEQINHQKKVFKYIISQIGSNIVQRKNILNVSFPVTIFRKQSHLKSVARNFSFAPIFLQRVVNSSPQEKMKAAVLFQISTASLAVSMNKPFNPILGQTYQGFIDGCPIFLQQISHHPPICRYLFYGRGFRTYGTIEPKIGLGLNCAKGWSPPLNYIQFDDGTLIQFQMNVMVINGMLFGQRTFNFEGINSATDRKNKIIAEICYGISTNAYFKKKQLTYDSVSGAAFKIPSAIGNQKNTLDILKRNEKQKLFVFNGVWHSQMSFDGKPAFNFSKDMPPCLVDYQDPIPSDSCYRTDCLELIKGDIQSAQKEKDFLQQIQRRDKKLRQTWKSNKKIQ